ncbi:hypothetical protein HPB52_012987 [Rhipicephalus sanguineus]|uniref:Uncharacterized protein n=1 Tax=Rhipicephalus sanguineus TaxID=34632 RepID=A0A9D4T9Z3_RHISA|nr:hypothetical protein HPB52_012987 [Rhipicephalus sanguineus]
MQPVLYPATRASLVQVEGDVDSLATLTPCGSSVLTANGSPCSPVAPPLLEAPPPPSTDSLTPEEPQRRKGSWTELFLRGRSPQRSSGTSPEPTTKGFFSSLLKLGGRKSPRSPSPHSPSPVPTAPRLSVTLHDDQPEDGVPVDSLPNKDLEINDPFDRACLLERVCQSLADIPSASRRGSRESPEQLSSESELTLDAVLAKQSSQDEFETLLAQDSVESEEFLSVASAMAPPPPLRSPVPTRQQRLEVHDAHQHRANRGIPAGGVAGALPSDKIRLFLPGEQFTGRGPRSPRRSSLKSWLHFCEEGLQSPRSRKRSEDSQAAGCCDCPGPEAAHSDCTCDCHHQSPGSSSLSSPEHAS